MTTASYLATDRVTLHHGDCLDVLRELPDASVHAVVTDPPYGLEFMGKDWDRPWAVGVSATGYTDGGERLARPAFGDSRNANCGTCGGRQRGAKRCECAAPKWDRDPAEDMRAFGAWCELWAVECLRVLTPGGHLLAFGGTRTWHRLACAIEDAGFEVRDSIAWLYGSGFPKSLDVSKAIDKAAGAERPSLGVVKGAATSATSSLGVFAPEYDATAPATPDAARWQGWGTALKPAHEPIVVARKPLTGTVAATVLAHGTGALNVDGCRVASSEADKAAINAKHAGMDAATYDRPVGSSLNLSVNPMPLKPAEAHNLGRWPANVLLDGSQADALDEESGVSRSSVRTPSGKDDRGVPNGNGMVMRRIDSTERGVADEGGASRFFPVFTTQEDTTWTTPTTAPAAMPSPSTTASIAPAVAANGGTTDLPTFRWQAKAPTDERPRAAGVAHPTVKPLDLMRWLVRLVTPPGGVVLEPFAGSGTTVEACLLEGFRCVAIEREATYLPLIVERIHRQTDPVAYHQGEAADDPNHDPGLFALLDGEDEA